jgi:hypothetical protein
MKAPQISPAQERANQLAANMRARQFVIENAVDMWQPLPAQSQPTSNPRGYQFNFQAKNVGLIKRFVVEVSGTLVQAAAESLARTTFGPSNIFSNIILTDLNNIQRINTTGWHMYSLATARRQRAYGAAFTNDSPVSQGSNTNTVVAPTPVTTVQTFRFFYEIPVSYSDTDLRGAIYAATTGANVSLQLTVNPNFVVASTANPTQAVYISNGTDLGTISNLTITVYQNYLDQIPMDTRTNQPILPLIDMSYSYMMLNTVLNGLSANQENSYAYSNWRSFLSTMALYDNFGTGTAEQADINYFAIQVANSTNLIKYDPYMTLLKTREIIGDDYPSETARALYYFDHRVRPINTDQYGNTLFVVNPAQVQASTSQFLLGLEMMALQNNVLNASSPARY